MFTKNRKNAGISQIGAFIVQKKESTSGNPNQVYFFLC
ncbi:hypothetical protein M23134_03804 [Microscilla marina ATCC 23134]|uniref:Uncharacterized protein n=1 Tax=Microscilla marina ATCC 23134 TaxID=313606 RepID=A1ZPJ6_MICM2|nr:hypothetical protein M23134_03804 [Microscilla marina ATCC 23134]